MNSMTQQSTAASYMASRGTVFINKAGEDIRSHFEALRTQVRALNASHAGALFARLFTDRPWLQALRLSVCAEQASLDKGGSYRSISLRVSEVRPLSGAQLPDDLAFEGELDHDAAAFALEASLVETATDLYDALSDNPTGCQEIEETIQRSAISELLLGGEIDGRVAFARLCPERAAGLGVA